MELNQILLQIDSLKKEAEDLQPVKPELERVFWDKFRLEFNYNSNHLEGNTLTYKQTKLLLLFDRVSGDNKGREIEEMKAHDVALKMIKEVAADPENELNEKLIREINELILVRPYYNKAQTPDGKETRKLIIPGKFKKYPNHVLLQDGEMFHYASPEDTPALMGELVDWYRQEKDKIHPVQLAALFHYKLVRIHPFDDSNGRTTRLVMNYILMQKRYAPIVIESKKKEMYLAALNKADVGDINAFVDYIAGISIKWQEIYLKAVRGENIEEESDFDKEVELLKRNLARNKGPKAEISSDAIKELVNKSFIPLLKSIENKLSKFDELFFRKSIILNGNGLNLQGENISEIEHQFELAIENLSQTGRIQIEFLHIGFIAADTKIFDYYTTIGLTCHQFKYQLDIGNQTKPEIEKVYYENLAEDEIRFFCDKLAKAELGEIKNRSNPLS